MPKMRAAVFVEPGRIILDEKPIPEVGPLDALVRVTTTTICGTDVHILKGEYPVRSGLIVGHAIGDRREVRLGGRDQEVLSLGAVDGVAEAPAAQRLPAMLRAGAALRTATRE